MICIVVNHNAGWSPSFINIFTGQGALFASAAEGFFTISGILVGYIYGPKILKNKKQILLKLWRRAGILYVLTVTFTVVFTVWDILAPDVNFRLTPWSGSITDFIIQTLTLQFAFGWHEFLRQYAIFMFIAPFALFLCAIGRWWIVLITSALILLFAGHQGILNPFSSWQIIFVYSLVIGYYLPSIERKWEELQTKTRKMLTYGIIFSAALTYSFSVILFTLTPALIQTVGISLPSEALNLLQWIISFRDFHVLPHFIPRENMSLVRLFFGLLWFSALYITFRKYEYTIENRTRGILSFFGKNSLVIFCLHAVLLFLQDMLIGSQPIVNIFLNTIIHTNLLVSVFLTMYIWKQIRQSPKPDFDVK